MLTTQSISQAQTEKIGFFRFKKFDPDTYLITNDAGRFAFLTVKEFDDFLAGKIQSGTVYENLVSQGFIKEPAYERKMTGSYVLKNNFLGTGPTLHMVVTTLRCNHHCKYCHAAVAPMSAKELDMSIDTARKVLDTIFHTNSTSLTIEFQGGESLVNWDVVQFMVTEGRNRAYHLKKTTYFNIVTNLTLMTDEKLEWLLANDVSISTSLDGDKVNHNNNRTGYDGDSFERVTYWIKRINNRFTELGSTKRVGAILTVTRENFKDYKNIIDAYVELGLNNIFLRWLNPYGFAAADLKNLAYKEEEWVDFYQKSLDYILELNKKGVQIKEITSIIFLKKILASSDPSFMDIRSPSGIAIGGVAYNFDGKVYASDESRMLGRMGIQDFLMTDMLEDGKKTYEAMMNSDICKIAVQSSCLDGLPGYNDHAYKPYMGVDIIHNFKMYGSIYQPMATDSKTRIFESVIDYLFYKIKNNPEEKEILYKWAQ